MIIFGTITCINIFIIVRRKSDANMHVFLYSKLSSKEDSEYLNKENIYICQIKYVCDQTGKNCHSKSEIPLRALWKPGNEDPRGSSFYDHLEFNLECFRFAYWFQRSVIAHKLLLKLLLNFECIIKIT